LLATSTLTLADGIEVRHAQIGSGPPVVMTHGYPDNLQIWSRVARNLASGFTVHAFDWPGLGHSPPFLGGATPFHLAAQLEAVLDAIGAERAHLVGLDMGTQPALVFAARHPDRVDRLVATNALVVHDAPTSWDIRVMRDGKWNARMLRIPHLVFARARYTFLPRGVPLTADVRADLWDGFRRPATRERLMRMSAGYQASLPRLPAEYRSVAAPVLALWGERDAHFPPAQADTLAELEPGSRVEIVPAGPHWMAWSHPEVVSARLREFFA
jgi:pimeloyl-ACP methyl ester carboxylesterase